MDLNACFTWVVVVSFVAWFKTLLWPLRITEVVALFGTPKTWLLKESSNPWICYDSQFKCAYFSESRVSLTLQCISHISQEKMLVSSQLFGVFNHCFHQYWTILSMAKRYNTIISWECSLSSEVVFALVYQVRLSQKLCWDQTHPSWLQLMNLFLSGYQYFSVL